MGLSQFLLWLFWLPFVWPSYGISGFVIYYSDLLGNFTGPTNYTDPTVNNVTGNTTLIVDQVALVELYLLPTLGPLLHGAFFYVLSKGTRTF